MNNNTEKIIYRGVVSPFSAGYIDDAG